MERYSFLFFAIVAVFVIFAYPASSAAGTPWDEMFADGLKNANQEPVSTQVLDGKLVGLYFSGHWCPDCRRFTPRLITFRNLNQADIEIVLISYDKSEAEMWNYMSTTKMPWVTAGYKSASAEALKARFKPSSIPHLVVLSQTGKVITVEGVADVQNAPETCIHAWKAAASQLENNQPSNSDAQEAVDSNQ